MGFEEGEAEVVVRTVQRQTRAPRPKAKKKIL